MRTPMELSIHPVIRLVVYLILAGFFAAGDVAVLLAGATLLGITLVAVGWHPVLTTWRMLARLRWLFVSILVLYLAFTPGTVLIPAFQALTYEGLLQGAERIMALALLVLGAQLLAATTSQAELLAALFWLARPLGVFGLSRERFAVRVALALEAMSGIQTAVATGLAAQSGGPPVRRIAGALEATFQAVAARAEAVECRDIEIPLVAAPRPRQWLWPLLLATLLALVAHWGG